MFNIFKITSKNMQFLAVLAVVLIVLIAYGQTLGMYFWQDDSALIFKLQNPDGPAGSYGKGIIGEGPYKYLITPFVPFFPIFGLEPFGYFFVGFLAYCISAAAFYLLSVQLFQSKKAGFVSTLIFAAGYVGSDTMLRISNSWQTNFGLSFALLSFWAYVKFFRNFKIVFYGISLLFFFASVEFVFIRSHSLIAPILALDLLFTAASFRLTKFPMLVLRQVPFWYIFYSRYLSEAMGTSGLSLVLKNVLAGKTEVLASFFATLGNTMVPSVLQTKFMTMVGRHEQLMLFLLFSVFCLGLLKAFLISSRIKAITAVLLFVAYFLNRFFIAKNLFWYRSPVDQFAGALGMYFGVAVLVLAVVFWKKQRSLSLALIFGFVMLVSQIFGYYIQYQEAIFSTTHRYLSYSFVGYSIIIGAVSFAFLERKLKVSFIFKKYAHLLALLPLMLVLAINLYLGFNYQNKFAKEVSQPTRDFYKKLKQYVPSVQKGAVFYFDVEDNNVYKQQFKNFFSVGSMPESTALAIYFGVDRYDVALIEDFNELLFKIWKKEAGIENIYSFYYGPLGLVNTTQASRILLKEGSALETLPVKQEPGFSSSALLDKSIKIKPLVPMLLKVKAKLMPDIGQIVFPYSANGQKNFYSFKEKEKMLSYLLSRQNYYKQVSVSSLSQWKFQEINHAVDNNLDTSWRGHRIYWHEKKHEQIILDLGSTRNVGKVVWTNWNNTLTPTSYTIDISLDGENWKTVKKVSSGPERKSGEVVVEDFAGTDAQFVRMDIGSTLSNDAPALSEIEVVDAVFHDVDIQSASVFAKSFFSYIESREELDLIFSKVSPLLNIEVNLETDKLMSQSELPVGSFEKINTYEFILPAGGTAIKNISIKVTDAPVKLEVQSAILQNLSLQEIEERGLIKKFVEN